ncbi:hypothetical protein ASE28_17410 [Acidovorax sp. Root219]|nr:hypothetical protein ASE28_17410 [Acidovorax sp. Root219]
MRLQTCEFLAKRFQQGQVRGRAILQVLLFNDCYPFFKLLLCLKVSRYFGFDLKIGICGNILLCDIIDQCQQARFPSPISTSKDYALPQAP